MELKTPLYDAHVKAGGKIVPFVCTGGKRAESGRSAVHNS